MALLGDIIWSLTNSTDYPEKIEFSFISSSSRNLVDNVKCDFHMFGKAPDFFRFHNTISERMNV